MKRRSKLEEIKAKAQQKTNETKTNKTSTNRISQEATQNQNTGQELLLWMADIKDEYILEAEDCKTQQTEKRVLGYLIAVGTFVATAAIFTAVLMQSGRNWFNQDKNPIQLPVQTRESDEIQESEEIQKTEWESETSTENVTETPTEETSTEVITGEADSTAWLAATSDEIYTDTCEYRVVDENVFRIDRVTGESKLISTNESSELWNGNDYMIYQDGILYFTTLKDSAFSILAYNEVQNSLSVVYTRTAQYNAGRTYYSWGELYLIGKSNNMLIYYDYNTDNDETVGDIVAIDATTGEELIRFDMNYEWGDYITVDSNTLIAALGGANTDGALYAVDLNTKEERKLSDKGRMRGNGNYIWNHVLYYLDVIEEDRMQDSKTTNQQYELVGYDLQTGKEIQRTALGDGTWTTNNGCFVRDRVGGEEAIVLPDTRIIPVPYMDAVYRIGNSVFCIGVGADRILYQLNMDTEYWEAKYDLQTYGIDEIPDNMLWATKLKQTDRRLLFTYQDGQYQSHSVFLQDGKESQTIRSNVDDQSETSETNEESQTAEETIWMPQYQVRYLARIEVIDEIWNWLEEYGCLEPYQKIQQYYEEYQAMYPAYNQGELHCYPGKVADLSYYGDSIVIVQNNMEYSYTGPAIYSKEELPQELENIYRYASYQYGDYSLSKNLEKLDLEECSRMEAADYCNGIMKQYGYEFASVDVYTITYEHIQEIVNDPRYKEWCFAPGYDPVNQTGGEWREGDDAYLIVYRDLSWNDRPIQVSEYASWNYAIYSPRYGLVWMTIQYPPEYLGEMQCAIISEEEALKEAEIKFKKEFADVETIQILSSEVVYSLDSDNRNNATYEYGNEWQGTFSPYWKVTFSMASMFSDVNVENAEQPQPVVDILVPAVQ